MSHIVVFNEEIVSSTGSHRHLFFFFFPPLNAQWITELNEQRSEDGDLTRAVNLSIHRSLISVKKAAS